MTTQPSASAVALALLAIALAPSAIAGPSNQYFEMMDRTRSYNQRVAGHLVSLQSANSLWLAQAMAAYPKTPRYYDSI